MIQPITRMLAALRDRGVAVSTAEGIDAARALQVVGLESREKLRLALRATLAKGLNERRTFDEIFDGLFVPPVLGRGAPVAGRGSGEGTGGRGGPAAGARTRPLPPRARREEDDDRRRLGHVARQGGARLWSELPSRASISEARRTRAAIGAGIVEGALRRTEGRLRRVVLDAKRRDGAEHSSEEILHRDLAAPLGEREERELSEMIPRLVSEIRLRPGRRLRRAATGRVWLRSALRENLRHGGVPFVLPMRVRRARRSRVILLVDVSYSVARSAGLFLAIALRLLEANRRTRVFLFVDRPVDSAKALSTWVRGSKGRREAGGPSFVGRISTLPDLNLDAPSDYGRAFYSLLQKASGGRDTTLVVLGDGRVNRFDPLPWAFRDLADRCRRVIWLAPEPLSRWGTGDSALPAYLPHCDVVVEARDLAGLARGITEILRSL